MYMLCAGDGKVYSWGRGTFGRLGTGSEEDRNSPVRVRFFGSDDEREDTLKIVDIAAGAYHSLALSGPIVCHRVFFLDVLLYYRFIYLNKRLNLGTFKSFRFVPIPICL